MKCSLWATINPFFWTVNTYKSIYGDDYRSFAYFDTTHLCWLAIFAVALVACVIVFCRCSAAGKRRFIVAKTGFALADEVLKYVFTGLTGHFEVGFLPFLLCSVNIFVCTWYTIRPNKTAANILYALSMPAALIALLMPQWNVLPMASLMAIHSESIHMLLFIFPLLMFFDGFRPDWRELPKVFLFLLVASIPAMLLNHFFDTNFMFLNGANNNPLLEIFVSLLGTPGYILGMVALLLVLWVLMYLPWALTGAKRRKNRKKARKKW